MKEKYFLSIDNGTQSVRAIVFDMNGQLIAKSKVEIEPYFSTQKGWAEQHANYFWDSLCQACQELWPQLSIPKEAIAAVSVTTQRATVVPMGKDNQPLRPAISWLDQRQVNTKPKLGKLESALMSLIRAKPLVDLMHAEAEANAASDLDNPTYYYDARITKKGKEQALKLSQKIKDLSFDKYFCSPLTRTMETFS